jgi:hypothetical protein
MAASHHYFAPLDGQAGFAMVCAGAIRKKNVNNTVRWFLGIMVKDAFANRASRATHGRSTKGHSSPVLSAPGNVTQPQKPFSLSPILH